MLKQWQNENQEEIDDEEERDSESVGQNLVGSEIDELYLSKQRLKDFIKNLGEFRSTGIQQSVLEYYNKVNERLLTPENVLRMTDKRVEKMLKNKKIKKNWSNQDVNILIWCLSKHVQRYAIYKIDEMTTDDWIRISELIPGSTPDRCMFKWLSLKKFNLANYRWQQTESNILSKLVNESSIKDWKYISQKLYKLNSDKDKIFRNAKQCREHWSCYLNPRLKKGPWEAHQDKKLLECILSNNGQKKWSQIARKFHGRTQNALKNRYNLIMEKQKKISKSREEITLIKELIRNYSSSKSKQNWEQHQEVQLISQNQPLQAVNKYDKPQYANEDQIYHEDNVDDFNTNLKYNHHTFKNEDTYSSPHSTPDKIVKVNFQNMMKMMKNNYDSHQQLVPAIMTNNKQFYINMVYGVHINL